MVMKNNTLDGYIKTSEIGEKQVEHIDEPIQKQGKTPEIRYPGYDDEWSECKLNNILTLLKGGTHETHKDSSEGCLLLSAKNIKNGKIFWNKTDRIISIEDYNKIHKNFKLQQGDVLLTIVGSIGETAILKNPENITFQGSVAYLRPDKSKLTAEYLNIVIQTRQFQNELDKRKAISAQPEIYLKDLRKIRVKIPSLPEQQQVGQFFQKIDQQITIQQEKIQHQKQTKQALLQQMFPQGDSSMPSVRYPGYDDEWCEYKLGETLKELKSGLSRKLSNQDIGLPVVRANNIKNNIFN
ncbi:MAG: restriction endonuclease subunit S, partial [Methanosphaera sp.]|uniref:restriction endonuclease subunit S n=1 Tax=Methanosphaera sp. TaxID=2666342 RepID=UPI0026233B73